MLLAAEKLAVGSDAFASGQVYAADLAANHVFGLSRRLGARIGIRPTLAAADDQIDDDEDSDEKEELCHAFFTTSE
jgi:hypothetical protein